MKSLKYCIQVTFYLTMIAILFFASLVIVSDYSDKGEKTIISIEFTNLKNLYNETITRNNQQPKEITK